MFLQIVSHAFVLLMFSATGVALGWVGNARMRELASHNKTGYLLRLFAWSMLFSVLVSAVLFAEVLPITTWGGAILTSIIVSAVLALFLPPPGVNIPNF